MTAHDYDLRYDANSVGADLVVETRISHSPRANDTTFNPQPADWVLIGDDDEPPVRSRVIRRDGNRVWVQLDLTHLLAGVSSATADAVVERLNAALGETEFKRCVSVGALMDPADVVRYARRSINLANTQPGSSTAIGSGSGHC